MRGLKGLPAADTRYPLTQKLIDLFADDFGRKAFRATKKIKKSEEFGVDHRNDIVSESLCDDTIEYLAPTLEQHKGCTIIDVHPGSCVWSSKLHDFLKPKRHLLMEPEKRYYDSFIKPLLEKTGSTYRHTILAGAHPTDYWENYQQVFSDPDLVPRTPLPADDPALRQIDSSLLIVANLSRQYNIPRRPTSVNMASMIFQHWVSAGLGNELFHNAGLIRTLLWLPETEKYALFPINEVHRKAFNTKATVGATITEAVGTLDLYNTNNAFYDRRRKRPAVIEARFTERVQRQMEEIGMQRPEKREYLYTRPDAGSAQYLSPLQTDVQNTDDLEAEIEQVEERYGIVHKHPFRYGLRKGMRTEAHLMDTLQYPQSLAASSLQLDRSGMNPANVAILVDLCLRIMKLEVGLQVLVDTGKYDTELPPMRERILKLGQDVEEDTQALSYTMWDNVRVVIDQQQACFVEPPLIALDTRNYEPLKADPSEFWPRNRMMLLDVVPNNRDLSVPDLTDRAEGSKLCDMLLKNLMQSPTMSLGEALERMAPNASKDLIPMVPAATDPRRGGRLDPYKIRTRLLSADIIEGLVKAWVEWPFKPSMTELELAAESAATADDEGAEDPKAAAA